MIWLPCTGDACAGDVIRWIEAVWPVYKPQGRFRTAKSPKPLGERTIIAKIIGDSYGVAKQQHTFTLVVIEAAGYDPPAIGDRILRKGRNVYRNGTERHKWEDEAARTAALEDKHARGDQARQARQSRREIEHLCF